MREIKFRVYDKSIDEVNYKVQVGMWGDNVLDNENYTSCSLWDENDMQWKHFEPYDKDMCLMQYVGIKDFSGKDIYEGDILLTPLNIPVECKIENGILLFIGTKGCDEAYTRDLSSCKIIGNKHSNRII